MQASSLTGQLAELLTDNPMWPDFLNCQAPLPEERPIPVRPNPAAVQAVLETTFEDWMDLAFPALGDR